MRTVEIVAGLLAVIAVLGVLADRARLPYPAVLVLGGIAIGVIPGLPTVRLEPQLVLYGFIPLLVYAAAFRTATFDLRSHAVQIISLATGLVLLTVVVAGAVVHAVSGVGWIPAFVCGALAAPTDPISATAVIGEVGAPEEIVTILEGESLINDGTGLAVFQVAVAAVAGGFSVGHGALELLKISAGGCAVGLVGGWILVRLRRPLDAPSIEIVLGLLAAYGTYVGSEAAGFSGVLAAVTAGVYAGYHSHDISSPESRLRMEPFWDATSFVLESMLFLLIGLQLVSILDGLPSNAVTSDALAGVAIVGAVMVLRLAWMLTVAPLLSRVLPVPATPRRQAAVLSWSGMRGALSLAGALSIPLAAAGHAFPARDQIIFFVYCVVIGTLIVPSFTLKALIRRLGLGEADELRRQEIDARMRVAHAALAKLEELAEQRELPEDLLARLRGVYELRLARLEGDRRGIEEETDGEQPVDVDRIRTELVRAQREVVHDLRLRRAAAAEVLGRIEHDIDLEETRLRPAS